MPRRTSQSRSLLVRATKSFKQHRSAATHEALLRAARQVFESKGFEATQTPDIAAAAGVSTGAFYRYFKDKKQVFLEVLVTHLVSLRELVRKRLAPERFVGADARTALDVVLDVLFEVIRRDAALHKVFMATSMSDVEVAELRAEFEAEERAELARLIGAIVPRSVVSDPDAAAIVVEVAALEVAVDCSGMRSHEGKSVEARAVKRALGDMFYSYLFAGEAPRRRSRRKGRPPSR